MSKAFINKNFSKLWASQVFSLLTINMANFILMNHIYEQTGSTLAVTLIWVFYSLPAVFIGPFSGFIVDLWSKRKIMIITNLLQGIVVASFFLIGSRFYLFYLGIFIYALLNQLYFPSEASSIPWLVKKQDLPKANSLFLFTAQLSLLLGFGGGGILLMLVGEKTAIAACVAFSFCASVSAWGLPKDKILAKAGKNNGWRGWMEKIKEGWSFLGSKGRLVLISFGIMAGFQIITASLISMLPVISQEIFQTSLKEAIPKLIVPLATGLIGGAWFFNRSPKRNRKNRWIGTGSLIAGASLFSLSFLKTASGRQIQTDLIAVGLIFILGTAASIVVIPTQTFIQEFTPASIRGRVFSILGVIITVSAIPPVLLIARTIDLFGVQSILTAMGIASAAVGGFIFLKGHEIITNTHHRD